MNLFIVLLLVILCIVLSFLTVLKIQGGYDYTLPFEEDLLNGELSQMDIANILKELRDELTYSGILAFREFEMYTQLKDEDIMKKEIRPIYKNYIYAYKNLNELFEAEQLLRNRFSLNMFMVNINEYKKPKFNNPAERGQIKTALDAKNIDVGTIEQVLDLYDEISAISVDYKGIIRSLLYMRDELFKVMPKSF